MKMCYLIVNKKSVHIWLLLAAFPVLTGYSPAAGDVVSLSEDLGNPRFVPDQQTEVFVATGETARLICSVKRLHDKTLLWVRSRDLHIMSCNTMLFTADPRVSLQDNDGSFVLAIKKAQVSDSGRYECQLNTEPKMSLFFNLTVFDQPMPKLKLWISGPPSQHAPKGHTMTFTCEARYMWKGKQSLPFNYPLPPISLQWLHENQPLQAERGGILVDTDRTPSSATSRLTVADVSERDEGDYTCVAGQNRDHLVFHLQNDDYVDHIIEAMQRDQYHGSSIDAAPTRVACFTTCTIMLLCLMLRTFYVIV